MFRMSDIKTRSRNGWRVKTRRIILVATERKKERERKKKKERKRKKKKERKKEKERKRKKKKERRKEFYLDAIGRR